MITPRVLRVRSSNHVSGMAARDNRFPFWVDDILSGFKNKKHAHFGLYAKGLIAVMETVFHSDVLVIRHLYVTPEHRGMGYGRVLVHHARMLAKSHGGLPVYVYPLAGSETFWFKMGLCANHLA